ncbi:MAG: hypothetical protein V3U30_01675 [Thermoplasmata archaeon]
MSSRRDRPYRAVGILLVVFLIGFVFTSLLVAGLARAGDVASADVRGELGLGAAPRQATVSEGPRGLAGGNADVPWVEASLYLLVASLIFAGYALAARRAPWLRPRRHRKA